MHGVDQKTTLELKLEKLRHLCEKAPEHPIGLLALAETAFRRGLRLEALEAYQKVLKDESVAEAHLCMAQMYRQHGLRQEALAELRILFEMEPGYPEAHIFARELAQDAPLPEDLQQVLVAGCGHDELALARVRLSIARSLVLREGQELVGIQEANAGDPTFGYYIGETRKRLVYCEQVLSQLGQLDEARKQYQLEQERHRQVEMERQRGLQNLAPAPEQSELMGAPLVEAALVEPVAQASWVEGELEPAAVAEVTLPPGQDDYAPLEETSEDPALQMFALESENPSLSEADGELASPVTPSWTPLPVEEDSQSLNEDSQPYETAEPVESVEPLESVEAVEPFQAVEPAEAEAVPAEAFPVDAPVEQASAGLWDDPPRVAPVSTPSQEPEEDLSLNHLMPTLQGDLPEEEVAPVASTRLWDDVPPPVMPAYPVANPNPRGLDLELGDDLRTMPQETLELRPETPVVSPPVPQELSVVEVLPLEPVRIEPVPVEPVAVVAPVSFAVEPAPVPPSPTPVAIPVAAAPTSGVDSSSYEPLLGNLDSLMQTLAKTRSVSSVLLYCREGNCVASIVKDSITAERLSEFVLEAVSFLEAFAEKPQYWVLECAGGIVVIQAVDPVHFLITIGQSGANFGALRYTMDRVRPSFEQVLQPVTQMRTA